MTGRLAPFSAVIVALCFALIPRILLAEGASNPEAKPPEDGSALLELYTESMDRTEQFVRDFRATLNRTTFDQEALLESLDYDADSIIEFVRASISFEQYPGVLRGPKGTLLSRAGNSIDQAILLAKLLRDAGYDARIAGAELDVLIMMHGKRHGFEFKYADAPGRTRSMLVAIQDLQLDRLWVVYPGDQEYTLDDKISVLPANSLPHLKELLHQNSG